VIKLQDTRMEEKRILLYGVEVPHPVSRLSKDTILIVLFEGGIEKVLRYNTQEEAEKDLLKLDALFGTKSLD